MLIKLIGCERYSFKGELFEKGFDYELTDEKAQVLLEKEDDYQRPYFVITTPKRADVVVEQRMVTEGGNTQIKRKRGRPPKNTQALTGGDTTPLSDDTEVTAEGIEDDDDVLV